MSQAETQRARAVSDDARELFMERVHTAVVEAIQVGTKEGHLDANVLTDNLVSRILGMMGPEAWDGDQDHAAWVKHLRGQLRLSQAAFAQRVGVTQDVVSKWESGTRKLGPDSVAKVRVAAQQGGINVKEAPVEERLATIERELPGIHQRCNANMATLYDIRRDVEAIQVQRSRDAGKLNELQAKFDRLLEERL